jgi:signal transduction histidine kinase/ActR/RegA family two-component response regulator
MAAEDIAQPLLPRETLVLALPPTRADASAMRALFASNAIDCEFFVDLRELCESLRLGAGSIILSEEAATADGTLLIEWIREQPVWSDLPMIILSRSGPESSRLAQLLPPLGNVSVVERPVRTNTLISLVRSSLRARMRQYEVRDHLRQREQTEEALRRAQQIEHTARFEAERSSRIKDEFLATLSHELRTPLQAILGWSQMLRRSQDLQKLRDGLSMIERNARSQAQIISDLLDMSSIISGKVRLDIQALDLAGVIEAAVDTVRPAADAKGIRLTLDIEKQTARGDPGRLQQVFWNLLTNAVKFTSKGGAVAVSARLVGEQYEVKIMDEGEGIEPGFLPFVFDRFRQADSSTGRRHGGLGLGLSIVKQLVELHGGTVSVFSEGKGSGTTFKVALPLNARVGEQAQEAARKYQGEMSSTLEMDLERPNLKGLVILVIDDEADTRLLIRSLLEECEAIVVPAASAEEALAILGCQKFNLIISDIGMPDIDGYALMRDVRALHTDVRSTPAIALTAYAGTQDRVRTVQAGYQMHLAKPVEPYELLAMVATFAKTDV